jgi:hypothetical protein
MEALRIISTAAVRAIGAVVKDSQARERGYKSDEAAYPITLKLGLRGHFPGCIF